MQQLKKMPRIWNNLLKTVMLSFSLLCAADGASDVVHDEIEDWPSIATLGASSPKGDGDNGAAGKFGASAALLAVSALLDQFGKPTGQYKFDVMRTVPITGKIAEFPISIHSIANEMNRSEGGLKELLGYIVEDLGVKSLLLERLKAIVDKGHLLVWIYGIADADDEKRLELIADKAVELLMEKLDATAQTMNDEDIDFDTAFQRTVQKQASAGAEVLHKTLRAFRDKNKGPETGGTPI